LSDEIVPKSNRKKETTSILLTHKYMTANMMFYSYATHKTIIW